MTEIINKSISISSEIKNISNDVKILNNLIESIIKKKFRSDPAINTKQNIIEMTDHFKNMEKEIFIAVIKILDVYKPNDLESNYNGALSIINMLRDTGITPTK